MKTPRILAIGLTVVLGVTIVSKSASALPLFSESAAQQVTKLLTLYPDHENPNLFYFMPDSSAFVREEGSNIPSFSLVIVGPQNPLAKTNGGHLSFISKLKSDSEQTSALNSFLKSHPRAGISVLPVMESTIGIKNKKGEFLSTKTMFLETSFGSLAGRPEDEIGGNGELTPYGALMLQKSVNTPGEYLTNYCYLAQGLGPSFQAKITVQWQSVYDHMVKSFGGGFWIFSGDVQKEVETLKKDNLITIEVIGGDASDDEYIRLMTEKIVARLFVNELSTTAQGNTDLLAKGQQVIQASNPGWSWARFSFSAASTHREELKTEKYTYIRRSLVTREFCLPLSMRELAPFKNQLVQVVD